MRHWGWSLAALCVAGSATAGDASITAKLTDKRSVAFEFPQSIQTLTLQDGAHYATFAPALPVTECVWDSDTQLRCETSRDIPKATRFTATLSRQLRTMSGAPLPTYTTTFETERPVLQASIVRWEAGSPKIGVDNTLSATRASIASVLRATVDGKPVPVKLLPLSGRRNGHVLELPRIEKESTLVLSVVPGLVSTEGPLRGKQDGVLMNAIAGEPFQVRGAVCAGEREPITAPVRDGQIDLRGCVPNEQIRVFWSRKPDEDAIESWRKSLPAGVSFVGSGQEYDRVDRNKKNEPRRAPAFFTTLRVEAPHRTLDLAIPALADAAGDTQLHAPLTLHLETVAPRPAFEAPFDRALLERGADPGLEAINAPPVAIDTIAIGRKAARTQTESPQGAEDGTPIDFPAMRDTLAEGGYVSVTPRRGNSNARDGRWQASAPDFDLHVRQGGRSVMLWANAWAGDAPIADAQATLWFGEGGATPRIVTRARTDADGLATLRLPDDFVLPRPKDDAAAPARHWYVRVERGGRAGAQRAVLPLEPMSNYGLGGVPRESSWGVVDRPVYRAGDTVHWTLWLRERRDGRDVAPHAPQTRKLKLMNSDSNGESPLVAWESTFDASGEATGEVRIPIHARDGDYCILVDDDENNPCFHVGTFRPQDMWLRGSTKQHVLRPGDTLLVDFESGFYSGGSVAGIELSGIEARMKLSSPAAAWPQWEGFAFASSDKYSQDFDELESVTLHADAEGRATVRFPTAEHITTKTIPFGLLSLSVEARPDDRDGTTSNQVEAYYAAFERYVGIKFEAPLDATSPVVLRGVVIDTEGKVIDGQRIEVAIGYADGWDDDAPIEPLHTCTLRSGVASDCSFPRKRSGRYIVTARSGEAAPTRDTRYVSAGTGKTEAPKQVAIEQLDAEQARAGMPIRLKVRTPVFPVRALLLVARGDEVIGQRVVRLDAAEQVVDVPTAKDGPLAFQVSVNVRFADDAQAPKDALPPGFRRPLSVLSATASIELPAPETPAVSLAFEPAQAAPTDTVRLVLRNDGAAPRKVTLSVLDDALRALGAEWMDRMDPKDSGFRVTRGYDFATTHGFYGWNNVPLRWVLLRKADSNDCPGQPADGCVITVVGHGAINPIDVSSVESTTILTAEQYGRMPVERDTTNVALLAPGTVRTDGATDLYSVEVSGYAMAAAAPPSEEPPVVFDEPSPIDTGELAAIEVVDDPSKTPAPPRPETPTPADYGAALARIRTNFVDTLLWQSGIELAPGETKTIDVVVPDNLTRWRAVAWSHDDGDDFTMTEAAFDAGLPLEARLQSPVRVYPGDTSRLAANVRQVADHASQVQLLITVADGERSTEQSTSLAVPAKGQASRGATIAPTSTGTLLVTAAAATPEGRDAVAASIEVASTTVLGTTTQASWIGDAPMSLALPALPKGAHDARMNVSVWRGTSSLVHGWTQDLHEYPHRCWEQILSRAIAAALAIERGDTSWPDAKAAVREALDNAAAFQAESGGMLYFNGETESELVGYDSPFLVPLTAYTVDAFGLLRSLGYAVPAEVEAHAKEYLANEAWMRSDALGNTDNEQAFAATVVDLPEKRRAELPARFAKLSLPARVAAARAFARTDAPNTRAAFDALLADAPQRGESRAFPSRMRFDRWMSSPLREQCEVIRLLEDYPQYAPAGARRAFVAGLTDLYAGGMSEVDTQAGAACLRALRKEGTDTASRIVVDATLGAQSQRIAVDAGAERATHSFALDADTLQSGTSTAAKPDALTIAPVERPDTPVAFLARMEWQEDARQAQPSAMGFGITRTYEARRKGRWVPIATTQLREGDWVRITLTVSSGAPRWFVAVTDDLPGGLRPIDMDLSGVSGMAVEDEDEGEGGWVFDQRKLDPRQPKFYAQYMPAGRHEVRYFARVSNSGDYLAAPAVVELMYGEASRARTAADRLRIADP